MATKRRASRRKSGTSRKSPKRRTTSKIVVVSGARRRRRRSTSAVGATKKKGTKRRRSGGVGKTSLLPSTTNLKTIAIAALGVATGAGASKFVIQPGTQWVMNRVPWLPKWAGMVAEILIGGMLMLKGKALSVKSAGFGIVASGVNRAIDATDAYKRLGIGAAGDDGYSTINVPISGSLDSMIAGILNDGRRNVRTNQLAGTDRTDWISGNETPVDATSWVSGLEWDITMDMPDSKGL